MNVMYAMNVLPRFLIQKAGLPLSGLIRFSTLRASFLSGLVGAIAPFAIVKVTSAPRANLEFHFFTAFRITSRRNPSAQSVKPCSLW
jgi:hypothetical protein